MTDLNINLDETVTFLTGLLNTPSPTGYAVEAIEYDLNSAVPRRVRSLPN